MTKAETKNLKLLGLAFLIMFVINHCCFSDDSDDANINHIEYPKEEEIRLLHSNICTESGFLWVSQDDSNNTNPFMSGSTFVTMLSTKGHFQVNVQMTDEALKYSETMRRRMALIKNEPYTRGNLYDGAILREGTWEIQEDRKIALISSDLEDLLYMEFSENFEEAHDYDPDNPNGIGRSLRVQPGGETGLENKEDFSTESKDIQTKTADKRIDESRRLLHSNICTEYGFYWVSQKRNYDETTYLMLLSTEGYFQVTTQYSDESVSEGTWEMQEDRKIALIPDSDSDSNSDSKLFYMDFSESFEEARDYDPNYPTGIGRSLRMVVDDEKGLGNKENINSELKQEESNNSEKDDWNKTGQNTILNQDPSLQIFINELKKIIETKDYEKLLSRIDENVQLEVVQNVLTGKDEFIRKWDISNTNSRLWKTMNRYIEIGGKFEDKYDSNVKNLILSSNHFVFPYCVFYEINEGDAAFITGSNVNVREDPSIGSEILGRLTNEHVWISRENDSTGQVQGITKSDEYNWYLVETRDNLKGW